MMNRERFRKAALAAIALFAVIEGVSLVIVLVFPNGILDRARFQQWYAHVIIGLLCVGFGALKYWQETVRASQTEEGDGKNTEDEQKA